MQVRNDRDTQWRCRTLANAILGLDARDPRMELIHRALEGAMSVTCAERGTLFLISEDGQSLEGYATAGPEVKHLRCGIDEGIAGACFRTKEPIVVPDAWQDPRFTRRVDDETGFTTRSIVAVPVLSGDLEAKGVIEVISPDPKWFRQVDAELLACFAAPIWLSLSASEDIHRAPARGLPILPPTEIPIGASKVWKEFLAKVDLVASTSDNVLILGETGSGKERIAHYIHLASARASKPFVVVDCTTLVGTLAESQLFGHKKGAFTGADRDAQGYLAQADGGTLFIDELGELPKEVQAKLLRALQEKTFCRLGDPTPIRVEVRVIAATHRRVSPGAEGSALREDVYYRLAEHRLEVPPLRHRGEDAWLILLHMLEERLGRDVRVSAEVKGLVAAHPWPGNVRELGLVAKRVALHARGCEEVTADHVRQAIEPLEGEERSLPLWMTGLVWEERVGELRRLSIRDAVMRHGGNRTKVAEELKISRDLVVRICQKYGW